MSEVLYYCELTDVSNIKLAQPRNPYYWCSKRACRNVIVLRDNMSLTGCNGKY